VSAECLAVGLASGDQRRLTGSSSALEQFTLLYGPLVPTGIKIGSLVFKILLTSLVTDERPDRQNNASACQSGLAKV